MSEKNIVQSVSIMMLQELKALIGREKVGLALNKKLHTLEVVQSIHSLFLLSFGVVHAQALGG